MFSLKTAVKNFSNIYGQLSRKEIDFGEIIIDEKILQDNASIINYFFNLITLNPQIHIGQPFNLIFASSENQEGLDVRRAQLALAKALTRIKVAEK